MNITHIAYCKRSEGHAGGVPLFGEYMRQRLGATLWSWADCPDQSRCDEPEAAERLGRWLVATERLAGVDVVVVDGFWGRGLVECGIPVVSVAHGTWRGIARACGGGNAAALGDVQAVEYERLPVVAVSEHVRRELEELYSVNAAAVIVNGVDTDEFQPADRPLPARPVAIYPSDAKPKGGDVIAALRARQPGIEFRLIGAGIGAEAAALSAADVYVSPSRTEGCSYAGLQALGCGLPVVSSPVGLFAGGATLDGHCVGEVVTERDSVAAWELAISGVLTRRAELSAAARAWAVKHGSLDRWEREWRQYLESVMATTMKDITRKAGDPSPPGVAHQGQASSPGDLPLDTCGFCEQSMFGAFEDAARDTADVHQSPDRQRHERDGTEPPAAFKCRHCAQVFRRPPESVAAQVERIP